MRMEITASRLDGASRPKAGPCRPSSSSRRARLRLPALFLEQGQHLLDQRVGRDPVFLAQDRDGAVFDELVGPADPDDRGVESSCV